MNLQTIKIGTQVRPVCEDALPDVTTETLGKVIRYIENGRGTKDFYATILWDNGKESFLNAMFFLKTVAVVDEVIS